MKIVVLTGGVGGAKLVQGLAHAYTGHDLVAIVNTGDDFEHFGLHISPDIDTLIYTLADRSNVEQGWGRRNETWSFMSVLRELGGADWFQLGDGDLALHVLRSSLMKSGMSLSAVTSSYASAWSVKATILPMSDQPVRTRLHTDEGWMDFQNYFVERRCVPKVSEIAFEGMADAHPGPGVLEAIATADVIAVAPSNPYLSIDPILTVPGIRPALVQSPAPVVAVSPIVRGAAIKGPTAKLMQELGFAVDNEAIAAHYADFLDGLILHDGDEVPHSAEVIETNTMMTSLDDKIRVSHAVVQLADLLSKARKN